MTITQKPQPVMLEVRKIKGMCIFCANLRFLKWYDPEAVSGFDFAKCGCSMCREPRFVLSDEPCPDFINVFELI